MDELTKSPETFPKSFSKAENGDYTIGNVSLKLLAKQYQTPLYIMDEATIRQNCQLYTHSLKSSYPNHLVLYAGKANLNLGLLNIIADEGMGLDVVSGGELYTALKSNIKKESIYFHGNNKSILELRLALENSVKIVVDNIQEIQNIGTLATASNPANVLLRLKPEIEAHTHHYIQTGQIDSKFGIDQHDVDEALELINDHDNIKYLGIHSHIGSQIFDVKPFQVAVGIMTDHMARIKEKFGLDTVELNLGGGIGIQYTESDSPPDLPLFIEGLSKLIKEACEKRHLIAPKLLLEPGRSIVGNAGITIYTVGTIKEIPNVKSYIFIDGGMGDNPRPMMYQAEHTFSLGHASEDACGIYSIAGKFCESGDILAKDIELPHPKLNDLLVVYGTGAYNYCMASNYNRACRPAMVLVNDGDSRELVKRETFEDVMRLDQA